MDIDLFRIWRIPNALKAHRLRKFAVSELATDRFDQLLERLFDAYFLRGVPGLRSHAFNHA